MGHQFQLLGQSVHEGLASLNSSARCPYTWWWWYYSLMLLLQSYLLLLLLSIFSITFNFFALIEYYMEELHCKRKKAVSFQTFLMNFQELFSTSVVFIDFLHVPVGLLRFLIVLNCAQENSKSSCSDGATKARQGRKKYSGQSGHCLSNISV